MQTSQQSRTVQISCLACFLFILISSSIGLCEDAPHANQRKAIYLYRNDSGKVFYCSFFGDLITDDDLKIVQAHKDIEILSFYGTRTTGKGLEFANDLKKLKVLTFIGTALNDDCAEHLPSLVELESFLVSSHSSYPDCLLPEPIQGMPDFNDSGVSDKTVRALLECKKLKTYRLDATHISNESLTNLLSKKDVDFISLSNCELNENQSKLISESHAHGLAFDNCQVPVVFYREISEGKNELTQVYLRGMEFTLESATQLSKKRTLKLVEIDADNLTRDLRNLFDEHLPFTELRAASLPSELRLHQGDRKPTLNEAIAFTRMMRLPSISLKCHFDLENHTLKSLIFDTSKSSPKDATLELALPHLMYFQTIDYLTINHKQFIEPRLLVFENMKRLSAIDLSHTNVGDGFAETLLRKYKDSDELTQLILENTGVTDKGVKTLSMIQSIERLNIAGTKVTDAGIESLVNLQNLKALDLTGVTTITDQSVEYIAKMDNLSEIVLRGTVISSGMIRKLSQSNPSLEVSD